MSELKSSLIEAENESMLMNMQGSGLQATVSAAIGCTNLPVVENLQEACAALTSCNQKYKNLLLNHSESIAKLGEEFQEFDKEMAEKMGIIS